MASTPPRRVLWADHARDVNILICTSPCESRSVAETNDRVMVHVAKVHGLMVAGLGIDAKIRPSWQISRQARELASEAAPSIFWVSDCTVYVHNQATHLARPTTKAPETQNLLYNSPV